MVTRSQGPPGAGPGEAPGTEPVTEPVTEPATGTELATGEEPATGESQPPEDKIQEAVDVAARVAEETGGLGRPGRPLDRRVRASCARRQSVKSGPS